MDHELTGNVAQWPAPFMAASSTPHGLSWTDENIGVTNYQMAPSNEPMRFSNDEMESMGSQSLPQGGGGGGVVLQEEESELVPPDDRTIFLTFSKGYPISENEVKEFFTRYTYTYIYLRVVVIAGRSIFVTRKSN